MSNKPPFLALSHAQTTYPPNLFEPLIHCLRRRTLDYVHLPTLKPPIQPAIRNWETFTEHTSTLADELKGYGIMKTFSSSDRMERFEAHDRQAAIPPDLRQQIKSTLMAMEKVVMELSLEIEQNQFRLRRRDPRGQDERVLARKRDQVRGAWEPLLGELVGRVRAFYAGFKEAEELWRVQEERTLREGWGEGE